MFVLQNTGSQNLHLNNLDIEQVDINSANSSYPLYFDVYDKGTFIKVKVKHSNDYNSNDLIENMLQSYEIILNSMITNCNGTVNQVKYLKDELVMIGPFVEQTLVNSIIKQATNCPGKKAIFYSTGANDHLDSHITYKELNDKSNQIAHYLVHEYSNLAKSVIAVQIGRSSEFVILLLAILKTGACYTTISPTSPSGRTLDIF